MSAQTPFDRAIATIDAENADDPNLTRVGDRDVPAQLVYGQRMADWLNRLAPDASQALRLAVRCQHLRRWEIPRDQFPMTRPGYHQWRTTLAKLHADHAGRILLESGFDDAFIARVQSLVRKERLKDDPETQLLEDCACLVFLENEFAEFARRHEREKVIGILKRTWGKMSPRGREAAVGLSVLLPEDAQALLREALTG